MIVKKGDLSCNRGAKRANGACALNSISLFRGFHMLMRGGSREGTFRGTASIVPASVDRDFANAVINFALWRYPARVSEVIADAAGQLEAKGYSAGEIAAAIDELLDELEGSGQTRIRSGPFLCPFQLRHCPRWRCFLVPQSRHVPKGKLSCAPEWRFLPGGHLDGMIDRAHDHLSFMAAFSAENRGTGGAAFISDGFRSWSDLCQPPFTSSMTISPSELQPAGCCRRAATP